MLCQKTGWSWSNILPGKRKSIVILVLATVVLCTGCEGNTDEKAGEDETKQQIYDDSAKLAEGYREIYERAAEQENLDTLEVQQKIIDFLGGSGYAAVDRDDQINMVNYEQVEEFCKSADEGGADSVTIISLLNEYSITDRNSEMDREQPEGNVLSDKERWEKGYDLPIEEEKREEAETDCLMVMDKISDIYLHADKGNASNVVLSNETLEQMQKVVGESGYPVITSVEYCTMSNYDKMDQFLQACLEDEDSSVILYSLSNSGGASRKEYIFDGSEMYLLTAGAGWNGSCDPVVSYISYTRIDEWKYTEKGWFCYKLCVPEPPEVTEIVDGSELIRIIPLPEECRDLSEKYVYPLCYQGNNILCSNWDTTTLSTLDYNGVYEYFYRMKYGERFDPGDYTNGIPAAEFERVITEYLPVTAEEIREWAVYDEETQTYAWASLGCGNYNLSYFGTSVPEVIGLRENGGGSITLTVAAVCEMVIANDAVMTHELTIRVDKDGNFQYLGNKILDDGIQDIPEYRYRISDDG